MSQQSQRIDLRFGGVAVEVSLQKTSGKPSEAKHEVRRMIGDLYADDARAKALREFGDKHTIETVAAAGERAGLDHDTAHLGATSLIVEPKTDADRDEPIDPLVGMRQEAAYRAFVETPPDPYADLPPERVEQGIYLPRDETDVAQDFTQDGPWLDLTERFAEIDERTRIDGMEVVATIPAPSVPRHRVRDSYWIGLAPDADGSPKVLALLWTALRKQQRAAVVKWTKRTNQALGIIVASGIAGNGQALVLLEVEWSQNMRKAGPRVTQPLTVPCSVREEAAALSLVEALAEPASFLDSVRDERTAKRAELLEAARAGKLDAYEAPPEPAAADSDLSAVLTP